MHESSLFPPAHVCLTVLVPASFEIEVVDWLLAHPDWPVEFSVQKVAVRGRFVKLKSGAEKVGGFARRGEFRLIVERTRLDFLIAALRDLLANVEASYWTVPIEECGTFGGKT